MKFILGGAIVGVVAGLIILGLETFIQVLAAGVITVAAFYVVGSKVMN